MAYLSRDILESMGFSRLGKNVKISEKASIYEPEKMEIGDHSRIDDFCVVSGKIAMGRNVYIGPFCLVAGGTPGITFEDFTTLAYHAQVFSQSDDYSGVTMANPTVPAAYKSETKEAVHLMCHSIVGAGGIVGPGVVLAEGTSVGMGGVVLRSTEPWSIYVGVPAVKLKDRQRDLLSLEQEYLRSESQET
jgi:acetyltransferase-like isoleucine patch superfamily enzyme